ncbi:glucoamylase family protein [Curvibacter sp. RS43]|uniref:GH36-type glycosyl hydrolase domain-containing protein n=1 Tax=Curvibacter microcysteis TaxID=3026419 RepID=UPI00235F6BC4|nr:glucoamylase family protein [Curvibacter sp. RS43]MDD0809352.1 glucoamylase family protein [Curvibacter sp. RS43]
MIPEPSLFLSLRTRLWGRWAARRSAFAAAQAQAAFEPPLQAELFNGEQMERHGHTLALRHQAILQAGPDRLLARLSDNEQVLRDTYAELRHSVTARRPVVPAGEWLLDNFYLIEDQIRTARLHFSKGYSRALPLLADGPSKGYPRVYDIALEAISHGDGRLDLDSLHRLMQAYQSVDLLRLGELWAIPIMLRLAMIENLRRVGARIAQGMAERTRAALWADQMSAVAQSDPKGLILVVADMARSDPPLANAFVAELVRRLRGQGAPLTMPLSWIEQRLAEAGLSTDEVVQAETQHQAASQLSISNSIASLRVLDATDWREFVEAMSAVEHKLREDPGGVYGRMDFATRDRYRHAVERLAREAGRPEIELARQAVQLACQAHQQALLLGPPGPGHAAPDPRLAHVGHYLIGLGRPALQPVPRGLARALQPFKRRPLGLYLGAVTLLTAAMVAHMLVGTALAQGAWWWALLSLLLLTLGCSQLALSIVNWMLTLWATPQRLPRMDCAQGLPESARTLVVVPALLSTPESADRLVDALELRFLGNQDPQLFYGLLTDFADAPEAVKPGDAPTLARLQRGLEALNQRYGTATQQPFYGFHRPRLWNPREGCWMGLERKRGKLAALNQLLLTGVSEPFAWLLGDLQALRQVRYVITLDTDTLLPRDSARRLVCTLAHPLNQAVYDPQAQRVTQGYAILQPRMAATLPSTNRSRYARLFGGDQGVDPYTGAASDVYQDVFQEGSYIGKGIYDLAVFEQALAGRFPDDRILSHDLLEGCYARAGLVSDVILYEDTPALYASDVQRRQRWIRGDWQIAAWLLPRVPMEGGRRGRNPLSRLSQWKLLDNLRRSLVAPALLGLLALGWVALPQAWGWTLGVLGILFFPALAAAAVQAVRKPGESLPGQHARLMAETLGRKLWQGLFTLACLPIEAAYSLDAVLRTLWRLRWSHRHLLVWQASGEVASPANSAHPAWAVWRERLAWWPAPAWALLWLVLLAGLQRPALWTAAPLLALWALAPVLERWLSRAPSDFTPALSAEQRQYLGRLARRTWHFFETFVTREHHHLPPDNYQEQPQAVLAHRTSPTNIGLSLLANLAAYDFGYLGQGGLIERTRLTLDTLETLPRYQGHFYNWYDTLSLAPLAPLYVSAVDSGNLAGHLLTLRSGLLGLAAEPVLSARTLAGLADTVDLLQAQGLALTSLPLHQAWQALQAQMQAATDAAPALPSELWLCLGRLEQGARHLAQLAAALPPRPVAEGAPPAATEFGHWAGVLAEQAGALQAELLYCLPWVAWPEASVPQRLLPMPTGLQLAGWDALFPPERPRDLLAPPPTAPTSPFSGLSALVALASQRARTRQAECLALAARVQALADMHWAFLDHPARHLLAIGYNVDQRRLDESSYDLLASEARLATFIAVAQGRLPQENWFALGRLLTSAGGPPILLSWSGSMFEYLMPQLVMPQYASSLLDQTCHSAVQRQIDYGQRRGVPWGISESGYNAVDVALNYQYRAFGVPGTGLKRGLGEDLVIAPYASALALMVMPVAACQNLQRLEADGLGTRYGLYEAVDYTASRLPRGKKSVTVQSFMAHHQGMSLLALDHALLNQPMQQRFLADPVLRAAVLLLHERIPNPTRLQHEKAGPLELRALSVGPEMPLRIITQPDTQAPQVQLLSNGRYHVMLTHSGAGYSRWKDLAVTRWREDPTRDPWGQFCYLRDVASQQFWSVGHLPTRRDTANYQAIFSAGRAEFRRRDEGYDTHAEIAVSPEDDIELRRLHITNTARVRRVLEVTSYAEVVLAPAGADNLHPAFSKLFVQTEIVADKQALLCQRRPRTDSEPVVFLLHLMAVHGGSGSEVSFETDRSRFIGRTRDLAAPLAMTDTVQLSGTQGAVLDPIVAIRHRITLEPQQSVTLDMVTGVAERREQALALIDKYRDKHLADRVFDLAWTHNWVTLQQINASETDAQLYGRLAGPVLYAQPALRAPAAVLQRNRRGQSGLWSYAISGDLPIVLVQIGDVAHIELVRQMVQAHAYWRLKGLSVDLVIWNEDHAGYRQQLQEQILGLIASGVEANLAEKPGGIFVRLAEQIPVEDRHLFLSVARVVLSDAQGSLSQQVQPPSFQDQRRATGSRLLAHSPAPGRYPASSVARVKGLLFGNGLGGFAPDGRAYVIQVSGAQVTPAPWVNVLANAQFGTVLSESGSAYTWFQNAHEFRLSPWGNDPVSDGGGEALYLRDEDSGCYWSPTPLPCGGPGLSVVRHGFGTTTFEHEEQGVHSLLSVHIDPLHALKCSVLTVHNRSPQRRRLSATGYVEWVLGDLPAKTGLHVVTVHDAPTGALWAHNAYSADFQHVAAFFDAGEASTLDGVSFTGDRTEFLGRQGSWRRPAAMSRLRLSMRVGAGLDPCAALRVPFELGPDEQRQFVFRLGAVDHQAALDSGEARVPPLPRSRAEVAASEQSVQAYWAQTLGSVQVQTPDLALNLLLNGWLLYQTLSCRLWARSGLYQSGGAFGFRDQLQDSMALVYAEPGLARAQLLLAAGRQFQEGDVQHWWHPPSGRGVRTQCSDDFLWLPQAVSHYVSVTGDRAVLDEVLPFLTARPVNPEDDSYYDLPQLSGEAGTLYEHCCRALQRGWRLGTHGLPLMGSGDWNDGMNLVGLGGRGESVWLAFFMIDTLNRFALLAADRGDEAWRVQCLTQAHALARHAEQSGWDGAWYRRAYFDDGSPLGSASNTECQIDSISQSWSVLSGAGDPQRARQAMQSMAARLINHEYAYVALLDPPFDHSVLKPGYIQGYLPGVRENGGQYTHAAIWAAMAFAQLGEATQAWQVFDLINPVRHADSPEAVARYQVEPYVMAADVYGVAPHQGRGGWTWYTGSAGWMLRLILESLLGWRLRAGTLSLAPCLRPDWEGFSLSYRHGQVALQVTVRRAPAGAASRLGLDGVWLSGLSVDLPEDGQVHELVLEWAPPVPVFPRA